MLFELLALLIGIAVFCKWALPSRIRIFVQQRFRCSHQINSVTAVQIVTQGGGKREKRKKKKWQQANKHIGRASDDVRETTGFTCGGPLPSDSKSTPVRGTFPQQSVELTKGAGNATKASKHAKTQKRAGGVSLDDVKDVQRINPASLWPEGCGNNLTADDWIPVFAKSRPKSSLPTPFPAVAEATIISQRSDEAARKRTVFRTDHATNPSTFTISTLGGVVETPFCRLYFPPGAVVKPLTIKATPKYSAKLAKKDSEKIMLTPEVFFTSKDEMKFYRPVEVQLVTHYSATNKKNPISVEVERTEHSGPINWLKIDDLKFCRGMIKFLCRQFCGMRAVCTSCQRRIMSMRVSYSISVDDSYDVRPAERKFMLRVFTDTPDTHEQIRQEMQEDNHRRIHPTQKYTVRSGCNLMASLSDTNKGLVSTPPYEIFCLEADIVSYAVVFTMTRPDSAAIAITEIVPMQIRIAEISPFKNDHISYNASRPINRNNNVNINVNGGVGMQHNVYNYPQRGNSPVRHDSATQHAPIPEAECVNNETKPMRTWVSEQSPPSEALRSPRRSSFSVPCGVVAETKSDHFPNTVLSPARETNESHPSYTNTFPRPSTRSAFRPLKRNLWDSLASLQSKSITSLDDLAKIEPKVAVDPLEGVPEVERQQLLFRDDKFSYSEEISEALATKPKKSDHAQISGKHNNTSSGEAASSRCKNSNTGVPTDSVATGMSAPTSSEASLFGSCSIHNFSAVLSESGIDTRGTSACTNEASEYDLPATTRISPVPNEKVAHACEALTDTPFLPLAQSSPRYASKLMKAFGSNIIPVIERKECSTQTEDPKITSYSDAVRGGNNKQGTGKVIRARTPAQSRERKPWRP